MNEIAEDWRRLATYVNKRRHLLGLTQQDIRSLGGPSTATMRLIEGALQDSYRPMVLSSLEKALRWAPGSIEAILAGGEPTPSVQATTAVALTSHARATAYPAEVRAVSSEPVLQLIDENRAHRPVDEVAEAARMAPDRWRSIIGGVHHALPAELARMAQAVGVQTFQLRRAGRADAADALQDLEIEEAHGDKSRAEIEAEADEIVEEMMEAIRKRRLDRDPGKMRVVRKVLRGLAETLADSPEEHNAS